MLIRQLRLEGPNLTGTKVNGPLLRDVLVLLIDGSQRALRLRTQGRSTARGALPDWIVAATEFNVQILEGSTVLQIELPSLLDAAPEEFQQTQLFPEINPSRPAIDYFVDSIEDALGEKKRSNLYDAAFLKFLGKLDNIFEHGVEDVEFRNAESPAAESLHLSRSDLSQFRQLEARIPRPQRVNVAGKLDTIRYSDRTFVLALGEDRRIRGIAEHCPDLQHLWGKEVLVSGTAHFSIDGTVQRIEADTLRVATDRDLSLFFTEPVPIARTMPPHEFRRSQGPRSGLNAIFGKWPGVESDEQITEALRELS